MSILTENGSIQDHYRNFIAVSRYSRWLEKENRRETWTETVARYIDFMRNHMTESYPGSIEDDFWSVAQEAVLNHKVMPSMRALMTAGPALQRENLAGYNCSFLAVDDPRAFDEALYILMCGVGLGFSVEKEHISKLPAVDEHFENSGTTIIVADTKAGWARGFRELIAMLYAGRIPVIDVSNIRPAGARLKTFGGRASGPQPLIDLYDFTIGIFKKAAGRKLTTVECHDIMCKIAQVVVVGGVRRSALISMSDLYDYDMAKAKSGAWWENNQQRALANNSATYHKKPSVGEFLTEWSNLYESKSGERGIINMESLRYSPFAPRRDLPKVEGMNPCAEILLRSKQLCVAGDTPIITKTGIYNIADIENREMEIWNGLKWSQVTARKTRTNTELVRVKFGDGSYLDCTPDHRFSVKNRFDSDWREVEARNLMDEKYVVSVEPTTIVNNTGIAINSPYTLGFAVGDGHIYNEQVYIDLYGEKDWQCPVEGIRHKPYHAKGYNVPKIRTRTNLKPEAVKDIRDGGFRSLAEWNRESVQQFFAGLADADGSMANKGIRIYISGENNARDAQLVLTKNGIRSSVNLCQKAGTKTNKGVRSRDLWYLQIVDARELPTFRLDVAHGSPARLKGKYQSVVSIDKIENGDAFCFTEFERHMAVFSNVLTYQCNLSEVIVEAEDNLESLCEKVRIATILGTIQSTLTNFKYVRKIWKDNCEEERLLGVSLTGQMGNKILNGSEGMKRLEDHLYDMRQWAIVNNKKYAERMGINVSTAITTVKPSGTVSQLTASSSGMHPWHNDYYIRSVRADNKDPLTEFMKDVGIPSEPDVTAPDNITVFYFPQMAPEGALTRNDLTALEHLELWKVYKMHWTEHNPSVTISVKEHEWIEVANWVYNNWDIVGCISFLPYSDHTYRQAPYEDCDITTYRQFMADMPKDIDWSLLQTYEHEDTTTGTQTLNCSASNCEVVSIGDLASV